MYTLSSIILYLIKIEIYVVYVIYLPIIIYTCISFSLLLRSFRANQSIQFVISG